MSFQIIEGDALDVLRTLPSGSVQCVVTSPPYYGLRQYGVDGQLGLEARPDCAAWATGQPCGECYVCRMVAVFREVRRVLRDDGVMFLNVGDSYAGSGKGGNPDNSPFHKQATNKGSLIKGNHQAPPGLKPKDLLMIPARLALALQADGWWLRAEIVWHKRAPMPESVTDRPTKAHEMIYLLSKRARYYYDGEAVREAATSEYRSSDFLPKSEKDNNGDGRVAAAGASWNNRNDEIRDQTRNQRDVWTLSPAPWKGSHFAVFPLELPERCIKAGTSARGCCPWCGAAWVRVVEREGISSRAWQQIKGDGTKGHDTLMGKQGKSIAGGRPPDPIVKSIGWRPGCSCEAGDPVPQTVLDPFAGAGTTLLVAERLGRDSIGIELNPGYVEMARARIVGGAPLLYYQEDNG